MKLGKVNVLSKMYFFILLKTHKNTGCPWKFIQVTHSDPSDAMFQHHCFRYEEETSKSIHLPTH
jgi:hypothetical protein